MGTEITNYEQTWAEQAEQEAKREVMRGGQFISTRGGVLSLGDVQMIGNTMAVIVLDTLFENSLYENTLTGEAFDEAKTMPPICYAMEHSESDLTPHESMRPHVDKAMAAGEDSYFKPQHFPCQGCQHNEWGSALRGKGKACQNRRRLTLLPAGFYTQKPKSRDVDLNLITDPEHFQKADTAFLRLPVTSTADWSKYVNELSMTMRRPPHGAVTQVWLENDAKSQFKVRFEMIQLVPDDLAQIVLDRHARARAMPLQGYEPPDAAAETRQQGAMQGLRRPGA